METKRRESKIEGGDTQRDSERERYIQRRRERE